MQIYFHFFFKIFFLGLGGNLNQLIMPWILLTIALLVGVGVAIGGSDKFITRKQPPEVPKLSPEEIQRLVDILNKKGSVEEIVEEAREKGQIFNWYNIDHLSDDQLIEVAEKLTKTQLRRWFKYHHDKDRFHFPAKAYARIEAKLNDQMWFTDEEFNARQDAGKRSTFLSKDEFLFEQLEETFYDNSLSLEEKMEKFDSLLKGRSKQKRMECRLSFFNLVYDRTRAKVPDEGEIKRLRSIKNRQTRAYHELDLGENDIDFKTLDELNRKFTESHPPNEAG